MSSRTSSSLGSKMLFPSRRQRTLCAATRVSWSTVCLLRSCCTVPMMVLAITTPKKVMFAKDPTNARQSASTIKTRLKNVKILSRMISVSLRVGEAAARLSSPAAMRWAACSAVRPLAGSVSSSGTCGRSGCGWAAAGCLPAGRGNCNFDKALSPSFYNNIGMSFYYKRDCMNKYSAHSIIPDFIYALNFSLAAHSSRVLPFLQKNPCPTLDKHLFPGYNITCSLWMISSAG